ncbi:MAG: tRNA lysidine(34) synthetase TilS [Bacilli bacterium]
MLERKVRYFLQNKPLSRIGIAVSGGVDSMVLLHLLAVRNQRLFEHVVVIHINHGIREESEDEAAFVCRFCEQHALSYQVKVLDVPGVVKATGSNLQGVARQLRYCFFEEVAKQEQLDAIMTAHHADDAIETQLFRYIRGGDWTSLKGIAPIRQLTDSCLLVRPLLTATKEEIRAYAAKEDIPYVEDASNFEMKYSRNRLRYSVIPLLYAENERLAERSAALSASIARDDAFLTQCVEQAYSNIVDANSVLYIDKWRALHESLRFRTVYMWLTETFISERTDITAQHVDMVVSLLQSRRPNAEVTLFHGIRCVRKYNQCLFQAVECTEQPKIVYIQDAGDYIFANKYQFHVMPCGVEELGGHDFIYAADELRLTVRTFQEGDRISLTNGVGRKKVKKLFLEQKIALEDRRQWPIIENERGEIVWIPGLYRRPYDRDARAKWRLTYTKR